MNRFPGDARDWTRQHAAIGQFVVEFEWICWHLRHHAAILLQMHGLKKWQLSETIFNQRVFTAEPLFSCYSSLIAEALGREHELLQGLGELRKLFQDLCKTRNDLLHASHLMGDDIVEITSADAPTEVHIEKRTPDKNGWKIQKIAGSMEELDGQVRSAVEAKEKFKAFLPKVMVSLHNMMVPDAPKNAPE